MRFFSFLIIVFVSLSGLFLTNCANNQKLNPREFTELYLDSLKVKIPQNDYHIVMDLLIISKTNSTQFFLNNAYSEYLESPYQLGAIMSHYLASTATALLTNNNEIIIDNIVPIIKPIGYMDEVKRLTNRKSMPFIYEKYNDQLIIVFAQDKALSLDYLNTSDFDKLNVSKEALLNKSIENLNKKINQKLKRVGSNGVYTLTIGGDMESSLLLLKEVWTKENLPVNGSLIIAVPNRDLVLVTGTNNKWGIDKIKKFAKEGYTQGQYPISPKLFKWNGHKFE